LNGDNAVALDDEYPQLTVVNARQISSPLEVLWVFLKLGLTSFGGPIAHLGYFREEMVVRRRWIDDATPSFFAKAITPALSIFSYSKSSRRPLNLSVGINENPCLPTPAGAATGDSRSKNEEHTGINDVDRAPGGSRGRLQS